MQSHLAASPRCLSPPRHAAGSRRVKATARGSRDAADAAACRRARAEVVQHDIALLPCARGRRAVSGSVTASVRSMWRHKCAKRCKVAGKPSRAKEAATCKVAREGSRRMMTDEPVAASAEVSDSMVSDRA